MRCKGCGKYIHPDGTCYFCKYLEHNRQPIYFSRPSPQYTWTQPNKGGDY